MATPAKIALKAHPVTGKPQAKVQSKPAKKAGKK